MCGVVGAASVQKGLQLCKKGTFVWEDRRIGSFASEQWKHACISQFVVWKALASGSIHEMSDNGAEEGSGELVNLAGRYLQGLLTHGGKCCLQGQIPVP